MTITPTPTPNEIFELREGTFGLAAALGRGGHSLHVLTSRGAVALENLLGPDQPRTLREMLAVDWERRCDDIASALEAADGDFEWISASDLELGPPIPDPSAVYCSGANFYDHIAEMGEAPPDKTAEAAYHFLVPPASLVGTGADVIRPAGVTRLDWEVELVAVIGRRADAVSAQDALDHVAAYTVANDISVREKSIFHHIFGVRWIPSKGQRGMTALGPSLVPARFVTDPGHLRLATYVNSEVRQDSNTDQMIWTLPEQIAALSAMVPLEVGDLILTGTPAGTAAAHGTYLADGDVVSVSVQGLGTLTNVVAPARQ